MAKSEIPPGGVTDSSPLVLGPGQPLPRSFPEPLRAPYPFPPDLPLGPETLPSDRRFHLPDNPLWRRNPRLEEPVVYKRRLIDIPVWSVLAVARLKGVRRTAESVTDHPQYPYNLPRVVTAIDQELNEVVLNRKQQFVKNRWERFVNFVQRNIAHTTSHVIGSTILALGSNVPVVGRIVSTIMAIRKGAPEEYLTNALLAPIDIAVVTTAGVVAATVPILGWAAAGALIGGNILLNAYVNSSAYRRFREVNNQIIPRMYNIMSLRRNPYQDTRRSTFADAFYEVANKRLVDLRSLGKIESDLNPKDRTNPDTVKMRAEYAVQEGKLIDAGTVLDELALEGFIEANRQEWWNIFRRFKRAHIHDETIYQAKKFRKIDDRMERKWNFKHRIAQRMKEMWELTTTYFSPIRP